MLKTYDDAIGFLSENPNASVGNLLKLVEDTSGDIAFKDSTSDSIYIV